MRTSFNIEKYNQGNWVVYTKGGLKVEILSTSIRNEKPIVGIVQFEHQDQLFAWFADGSFFGTNYETFVPNNLYDLEMELIIKPKYGLIDTRTNKLLHMSFYEDYADAKNSFNPAYNPFYKIVKINIEEICED